MADAFDVADYLISKADITDGDGLTNLKLQRLLYYCQGFSLALHSKPLFGNTIEAWANGPIVPDVYQVFKAYGDGIIILPRPKDGKDDKETLTADEKSLIDEVYKVYGEYSSAWLRNFSQRESTWTNAENKSDTTITHEAMTKYFPCLLLGGVINMLPPLARWQSERNAVYDRRLPGNG